MTKDLTGSAAQQLPGARLGMEYQARELGLVDEPTGLLNGDALFFLGEYQLKLARRTGRSFALLYITVENAEKTSEHALREMAQLLLSSFRTSDACAHLGAGEFCVLLSDVSHSRVGPEIACLRLLDRLEDMTLDGRLPFPVALRTGVASFGREDKVTFAEMVAHAKARRKRLTRGS